MNECGEKLNEMNVIEKSRALFCYRNNPFDLLELKILDIYLSRINARNLDVRTVRFSKKEFEEILDIKDRLRPDSLKMHCKSLMQTIELKNGDEWDQMVLFSQSRCSKDDAGKYWIELTCSPEAKKYFFTLEGIGYIKYRLRNVVHMSSKYSVFLFLYLLDNSFRKEWTVPLNELKDRIKSTDPAYQEFKYFHSKILINAVREINEKTDIAAFYEPVRNGRKVTGIKFKVIARVNESAVVKELEKDPVPDESIIRDVMDILHVERNGAVTIASEAMCQGVPHHEVTERMRYVMQRDNVRNIVGYALSLLNEERWSEVKPGKNAPEKNSFNDFPQRDYPKRWYDLLEKLLSSGLTESEQDEMDRLGRLSG